MPRLPAFVHRRCDGTTSIQTHQLDRGSGAVAIHGCRTCGLRREPDHTFRARARDVQVGTEQFRVQLNGKDQVDAARRAQQGGAAHIPNGRIIVGTSENAGWSWHLEDVMFVEVAIELCDGRPSDVERAGTQYGGGRFCPWSATIVSILEN